MDLKIFLLLLLLQLLEIESSKPTIASQTLSHRRIQSGPPGKFNPRRPPPGYRNRRPPPGYRNNNKHFRQPPPPPPQRQPPTTAPPQIKTTPPPVHTPIQNYNPISQYAPPNVQPFNNNWPEQFQQTQQQSQSQQQNVNFNQLPQQHQNSFNNFNQHQNFNPNQNQEFHQNFQQNLNHGQQLNQNGQHFLNQNGNGNGQHFNHGSIQNQNQNQNQNQGQNQNQNQNQHSNQGHNLNQNPNQNYNYNQQQNYNEGQNNHELNQNNQFNQYNPHDNYNHNQENPAKNENGQNQNGQNTQTKKKQTITFTINPNGSSINFQISTPKPGNYSQTFLNPSTYRPPTNSNANANTKKTLDYPNSHYKMKESDLIPPPLNYDPLTHLKLNKGHEANTESAVKIDEAKKFSQPDPLYHPENSAEESKSKETEIKSESNPVITETRPKSDQLLLAALGLSTNPLVNFDFNNPISTPEPEQIQEVSTSNPMGLMDYLQSQSQTQLQNDFKQEFTVGSSIKTGHKDPLENAESNIETYSHPSLTPPGHIYNYDVEDKKLLELEEKLKLKEEQNRLLLEKLNRKESHSYIQDKLLEHEELLPREPLLHSNVGLDNHLKLGGNQGHLGQGQGHSYIQDALRSNAPYNNVLLPGGQQLLGQQLGGQVGHQLGPQPGHLGHQLNQGQLTQGLDLGHNRYQSPLLPQINQGQQGQLHNPQQYYNYQQTPLIQPHQNPGHQFGPSTPSSHLHSSIEDNQGLYTNQKGLYDEQRPSFGTMFPHSLPNQGQGQNHQGHAQQGQNQQGQGHAQQGQGHQYQNQPPRTQNLIGQPGLLGRGGLPPPTTYHHQIQQQLNQGQGHNQGHGQGQRDALSSPSAAISSSFNLNNFNNDYNHNEPDYNHELNQGQGHHAHNEYDHAPYHNDELNHNHAHDLPHNNLNHAHNFNPNLNHAPNFNGPTPNFNAPTPNFNGPTPNFNAPTPSPQQNYYIVTEPEPIIEIIVQDSNVTLPPYPTQPPYIPNLAPPTPEPVHVFYVKYSQKNKTVFYDDPYSSYSEPEINLENPIASIPVRGPDRDLSIDDGQGQGQIHHIQGQGQGQGHEGQGHYDQLQGQSEQVNTTEEVSTTLRTIINPMKNEFSNTRLAVHFDQPPKHYPFDMSKYNSQEVQGQHQGQSSGQGQQGQSSNQGQNQGQSPGQNELSRRIGLSDLASLLNDENQEQSNQETPETEQRDYENKSIEESKQIPDDVPNDLKQQLINSGILNHAQVQVINFDDNLYKELSSLPPEAITALQNQQSTQQNQWQHKKRSIYIINKRSKRGSPKELLTLITNQNNAWILHNQLVKQVNKEAVNSLLH